MKIFKTADSAVKTIVGASGTGCSLGTGDKLGFDGVLVDAAGIMTKDGVAEAVTVDSTYSGFTPTTVPNGALDYVFIGNV